MGCYVGVLNADATAGGRAAEAFLFSASKCVEGVFEGF